MIKIHIEIPEKMKKELRTKKKETGLSMNWMARKAIETYLNDKRTT